jgi:hypothetical protein
MKRIGFAIYDLYNFFFDARINPLRKIPNDMVRWLLMFYLSCVWTAVFTLWVGNTIYFGIGSVAGHLMVITAFFITAMTFRDAEKNGHLWVKQTEITKGDL